MADNVPLTKPPGNKAKPPPQWLFHNQNLSPITFEESRGAAGLNNFISVQVNQALHPMPFPDSCYWIHDLKSCDFNMQALTDPTLGVTVGIFGAVVEGRWFDPRLWLHPTPLTLLLEKLCVCEKLRRYGLKALYSLRTKIMKNASSVCGYITLSGSSPKV